MLSKNPRVRTCDSIKERLTVLHRANGLTFREIAALPEFTPVPAGTLCTIFKGGEVPKKWRTRFGMTEFLPAPACAKCGKVHTTARCTEGKQPRRRWVRCAGHAGGRWE